MPAHHYQAIIFDFDDTLVRSGRIKWAHHKATAKEFYGLKLTDETLGKHWGMPFNDMIPLLYQHADTLENMRAANFSIEHRFRKTLQPDALVTIKRLHAAGLPLGVLSAMTRDMIEPDIKRFGFDPSHFLFVQGSEDTPVHKPDPGVFDPALHLLQKRGIKPQNILYVGDALSDYYAAIGAGLHFIGVTTGFVSQAEFSSAKAKSVASLTELLNTKLIQFPKSP
ncbi:MAG TPA: HAD family hydrolase [Candidatus Saccharimonadia bacterium]|nr:HAD family hydrolase [Candidatus Saccharimonadia bacterium]